MMSAQRWAVNQPPWNTLTPETLAYLQTLEPTEERIRILGAMEPDQLERELHTAMILSDET